MDDTRELRVYVRAVRVGSRTFICKEDVLTFMLAQVNLCRRDDTADEPPVEVVERMMATLDQINA